MEAGRPLRLRVATRASALARWQADHVASLLRRAASRVAVEVEIEPVVVDTRADRRLDIPIWEMGGKGAFVKEVQAAVLDRRADVAVHSCKDLPTVVPDGLVLAAVPERADPRDALVGSTLDGLPTSAVVATGSARRRAQLAWARPDLTFKGLRGNIATRLGRAELSGAIVVAVAALDRLGVAERIAEILDPEVMLPQVGQGALAVECRDGDDATREVLALIEDFASRAAVDAERAFLAELGGGCDLPAAAHAVVAGDGTISMQALIASLDGHIVLRHGLTGREPVALGTELARDLLDNLGGAALLEY